MKTKEELIALKNEVDAQNKKLAELSKDELRQVVSAHGDFSPCPEPSPGNKDSRTVPVSSFMIKGTDPVPIRVSSLFTEEPYVFIRMMCCRVILT